MKIAFCVNWRSGRDSGVYRKVASQAAAWRSEGIDVGLFVATGAGAVDDWAALPEARAVLAGAAHHGGRLVARERAARAANRWSPDVVYVRHGLGYPGLFELMCRYPVIIEINGDDVAEATYVSSLPSVVSRTTRGLVLRGADGLVFVTEELATRSSFARFDKPGVVIPNGIDLAAIPRVPPTAGSHRRMIFLGHPGTAWHGVDKLLEIARQLPAWEFDLVGPARDELEDPPPNVRAHGLLDRGGYAALLAAADLAVGSLAMHRAGIEEGSPLKVREYLAAGVPTVIAYKDSDFPAGADFLLRLPNTPDNVAGAASLIEAFASSWSGRRIPADAVAHLDVRAKERARLSFISRFVPAARGS